MTMNTLLIALTFPAVLIAYALGRSDGYWRRAEEDRNTNDLRVERYRQAIDDLDKWCGHASPHARLIAAHVRAVGEDHPMNAGTPHGSEPCTVVGLREQLRRIDAA